MHFVLDIYYTDGGVHSFSFAADDYEALMMWAQHYAGPKENWTIFYQRRAIGPNFIDYLRVRDLRGDYHLRQFRLELRFSVPMDIENP